jgi:hypothetical protein
MSCEQWEKQIAFNLVAYAYRAVVGIWTSWQM